jgi:hypothetical protein
MQTQIDHFNEEDPERDDLEKIKKFENIDNMDFEFKKAIEGGCQICETVRGDKVNFVKKDPQLYDFIVSYRNMMRNLP